MLEKKLEKDTGLTLVLAYLSTYMFVWKLPRMANMPTSHVMFDHQPSPVSTPSAQLYKLCPSLCTSLGG